MSITLTKAEVRAILDGDYIKGDFEKHHRHNGGYQDVIFEREGKKYLFTYLWFEDEGIYWDDNYVANECAEAEKTVKYWKLL